MNNQAIVWLASYPRSGNTMLRTILWHCFGLRSASIYPDDLGGDKELESRVGHIEHDADGRLRLPSGYLPLIKTHEYPHDAGRAIYVVRDGRAVSVSLWRFYHEEIGLREIISGSHRFGTWSAHLEAWAPWSRPGTLLLKYEDMTTDLPAVLARLGGFLNRKPVSERMPTRDSLAKDGRWIRKRTEWSNFLVGDLLDLFDEVNGMMMKRMGYF